MYEFRKRQSAMGGVLDSLMWLVKGESVRDAAAQPPNEGGWISDTLKPALQLQQEELARLAQEKKKQQEQQEGKTGTLSSSPLPLVAVAAGLWFLLK